MTSIAVASSAVTGVAPSTRRPMTAAIPITDAAARRAVDRVALGAGRASIRARRNAMAATRTSVTASHSGRVANQAKLLGSGRAMPVTIANTALMPAIASSTGICQR